MHEFAEAHGVDPADLEKVEDFAQEYGLDVEEVKQYSSRACRKSSFS